MADRELKIRFVVDDDGAVKKISGIDDAIERTGRAAERSDGAFSKFQANLISINQAAELAGRGFNFLRGVASATLDGLDRAATLEGLTRSFDNLQASIGNLGSDKLPALQAATKGLVSDQELLQQANQAVLLGVDDGSGKFEQLAAAALKLGQATGRTATEALTDLTTAVGRGSVLIADNLGVQVKATEAQELYAAKLGVATEALTDKQKAEALGAAIADQAIEKARQLAEVEDSAAVSSQQLTASIQNLTDRFLLAFSKNEELSGSISDLAKAMDDVDAAQLAADIASVASAAVRATRAVVEMASALSKNLKFINLYGDSQFFASEQATKLSRAIGFITIEGEKNAETALKLSRLMNQLTDAIKDNNEENPRAIQLYEELREEVKRFYEETEEASFKTNEFNKVLGETGDDNGPAGRAKDKIDELTKANEAFAEVIGRLSSSGVGSLESLKGQVADAFASFDAGGVSVEDLIKELEFLRDTVGDDAKAVAVLTAEIERLQATSAKGAEFQIDIAADVSGGGAGSFSELFGVSDSTGQAIGIGVDALQGLIETLDEGEFNSKNAGAAGEEIGSQLGAAAAAIVVTAFGLGFLAPVAAALGGALGGIKGKIIGEGLFGETDAEANARENFLNFLDTVFDTTEAGVIIEGSFEKLSEIFKDQSRDRFDPDENGVAEGFAFINSLSEETRVSFISISDALVELLKGFDEFEGAFDDLDSGQAAALLAEGLGGSLNNLQVALKIAGISVDELGEAMVQAALKGEASFLETQTALQQLGVLAEDGIPGQIGAITEAFNNMKEAGTLGGLTTIDALKDVGAEALELGLSTLPELEAALIANGVAAEDVAKLMESLAEAGITSIEDLANASDRTAIQILADLESIGFAFVERASEAAGDLISQLENIPDTIETTVTVNVETRAQDQGAEQVINSGALGLGLQ